MFLRAPKKRPDLSKEAGRAMINVKEELPTIEERLDESLQIREADEGKNFCRFAEIPLQAVLPHLDGAAVKSLRLVSKAFRLDIDRHLTWLRPKYLRAGEMLRLWPELHKLDLGNIEGPSYTDFRVLGKMTALHALSVRGYYTTTAHDIDVLSNLTKLTYLSLAQAKGLDDDWDFCVLDSLHNLKQLCLEGNCVIDGDHLFQTLSRCTQLVDLDMGSCENMTLDGVIQISCLQPLTRLSLSRCKLYQMLRAWRKLGLDRSDYSDWSSAGFEAWGPDSERAFTINRIFARHTGLKDLGLAHSDITCWSGVKWNLLSALTSLDISAYHCYYFTTSLHHFWDVTELQNLSLDGTRAQPRIAMISKLSKLTRLDFSLVYLTTDHLAVLTRLKMLRHLRVDDARGLRDEQMALMLWRLTKLQYLHLKRLQVSRYGLRTMQKGSSSLHTLRFPVASKIFDTFGEELAAMTKLTHIDLTRCKVTAKIANHLAALPKLRKLELGHCDDLNRSGLLPFSQLTGLHHLDICHCVVKEEGVGCISNLTNLTYLDLRYNGINDAALLHLRNMRRLKVLDLTASSVTDDGLAALSGLSELQCLTLDACKALTPDALDEDSPLDRLSTHHSLREVRHKQTDMRRGQVSSEVSVETFGHLVDPL